MELQTDVLIVGSGIAGLYTAIKTAEFADVILVTKKNKSDSNTNYAQGGIASVLSPADSIEDHVEDTLKAGAGLGKRDIIRMVVEEGPSRIQNLIDLGVHFTMKNGKLHLAKEGGHSQKRIAHSEDLTGKEMERALIEKVNSAPNIKVMENALAIDLITEHNVVNLKDLPINSRHCWGAYVLDNESGAVLTIRAKATVMATGGLGQVYLHTTNPEIATGDGFAMAYRAGAKIANMEFIQFHPTSLYRSTESNNGNMAFLISEAVRGFGGILRNKAGEEFMHKYDERKELAPRDVVARAIDTELKKHGDDYVYLDITHKKRAKIEQRFPNIYERCNKYGIDIAKDYIPVVPAAHYACGGIIVDAHARSSLKGLYAVGEVTMTGLHGANRLASNSLLEAVVYACRASINLSENLDSFDPAPAEIPEWDETIALTADEKVMISHNTKELNQLMWDYVGIVRSNLRLNFAARRIHNLYLEVEEFYKKTKVFNDLIELRNLITCAHLIVKSALQRKESRGLHYTLDYPDSLPLDDTGDTVIQNTYQKS